MGKSFLYLVQAPERLRDGYRDIEGDTADLILLTFKAPGEGHLFFPGSTWTTGRNRLIEEARPRLDDYEYVVFLDDDVVFERGNWRGFEEVVLRHRPAFAVPYCPWYPSAKPPAGTPATRDAQRCEWFDAIYNAVHVDVLKDGLLLPYHPGFDDLSWWFSQFFLLRLAQRFYAPHLLQMNGVVVGNDGHSAYPKSGDFSRGEDWFHANVLPPERRPFGRRLLDRAARGFGLHDPARPRGPRRPPPSYRLPPSVPAGGMVADPGVNPFLRRYLELRGEVAA